MIFRRMSHADFDRLVAWLLENDVDYDTKIRGGVFFIGLQPHIWKKIDFSFAAA